MCTVDANASLINRRDVGGTTRTCDLNNKNLVKAAEIVVMNDIEDPTWRQGDSYSTIDYVLCSKNFALAVSVFEWWLREVDHVAFVIKMTKPDLVRKPAKAMRWSLLASLEPSGLPDRSDSCLNYLLDFTEDAY